VINPNWANWNATTGVYEDATNQTGRYLEPVANVVTDTLTGLQWQKVSTSNTYNWTTAQAYCDNLFQSGFGDWRLPTRVELQSLVDYEILTSGPMIDRATFSTTPAAFYWSATPLAGVSETYWYVDFDSSNQFPICTSGNAWPCYSALLGAASLGYVRCVRPLAVTKISDRYRDEADNVLTAGSTQVKDMLTGLIWERGTSDGTQTWNNTTSLGSAQAYCQSLNLGGNSWRVPSIKELASLIDVSLPPSGVMTNSSAFPGITGAMFFWSSSSNLLIPRTAWGVNFQYGWVNFADSTASSHVRCVRGL
jgi:hypothetical protein